MLRHCSLFTCHGHKTQRLSGDCTASTETRGETVTAEMPKRRTTVRQMKRFEVAEPRRRTQMADGQLKRHGKLDRATRLMAQRQCLTASRVNPSCPGQGASGCCSAHVW